MLQLRWTAALVCALGLMMGSRADVPKCACDPTKPETLAARECSLCGEAEKQDGSVEIFFLKDINPRKPNRWLALPRSHGAHMHALREMSADARLALWKAAIGKAKEMWGEEWAVAYNGDEVRTQCHAHVHIGKFMPESETETFTIVDSPEKIPVPEGFGIWLHGIGGGKFHAHTGEQITEKNLMR